ncbi:hypothetical protein R50073_10930 [Maricurvus nonylphenolicus]
MEVSNCASSTATASLAVIGGAPEALADELDDELDDELEEELEEALEEELEDALLEDELLEELLEELDDWLDELLALLCSSSEKSISSLWLSEASAIGGSSVGSLCSPSLEACCSASSPLISPPASVPSDCSPLCDWLATSPVWPSEDCDSCPSWLEAVDWFWDLLGDFCGEGMDGVDGVLGEDVDGLGTLGVEDCCCCCWVLQPVIARVALIASASVSLFMVFLNPYQRSADLRLHHFHYVNYVMLSSGGRRWLRFLCQ